MFAAVVLLTLLAITVHAQSCNTALYSSAGTDCVKLCISVTDACQHAQCFVSCAQQEAQSSNQEACLASATSNCQSTTTDTTCDCANVPLFTSNSNNNYSSNGYTPNPSSYGAPAYPNVVCGSQAQAETFSSCCTMSGSACAISATYSSPTYAQQCACAQQVQTCQQYNEGCQNTQLGTQNYYNSVCYPTTYAYGYNNGYYTTDDSTLIAEAAGGAAGGVVLICLVVALICFVRRRRANKDQPVAANVATANVAENNPLFEQTAQGKDNPIFYETQSSLGAPSPSPAFIPGQLPPPASDFGTQSNFNTVDFAKQDPKAALYPNLSEQALPVLQTRPSVPGRINDDDGRLMSARFDAPPLYGDERANQYPPSDNNGLYPGVAKI